VLGHGRTPGVQHGGDTDTRPQALGVGRDREHGLGGSLEQQIVEDGLVLVGDGGDLARQRKHDVEIAHW